MNIKLKRDGYVGKHLNEVIFFAVCTRDVTIHSTDILMRFAIRFNKKQRFILTWLSG